jgi:hypothetical protein
VDELLSFATLAINAQTEGDLDQAASHLANAVAILGIQAVLAVLFRGAPKTWRGEGQRGGSSEVCSWSRGSPAPAIDPFDACGHRGNVLLG